MEMKKSRVRREKENGKGGREEMESTRASAHNLFRDNPNCGH